LFYGCTPFNTNNINDSKFVRDRILNNKRINLGDKKEISKQCKDFINYILVYEKDRRPTIQQIINHEFIS